MIRAQFGKPLADRRVATGETLFAQFLPQSHGGQLRIASQKFQKKLLITIQLAGAPSRWRSVGVALASGLHLDQDLADGVPRQSQIVGDLPDRGAGLPTANDLIALLLVHRYAALQ